MNAPQHQSSTQQQRGFTLTELMITIAIGAILAAVAVPNFSDVVGNSRIVSQTNEIISTVNRARSEAMKRNELVVVCSSKIDEAAPEKSECNLSENQYQHGWITYVNARIDPDEFSLPEPDPYQDDKDHQELISIQFGEDAGELKITSSQYGKSFFGFAPDGSLRAYDETGAAVPVDELIGNAINITVCDDRGPEFGRLVQILHTGRTRIQRPDDGLDSCDPDA